MNQKLRSGDTGAKRYLQYLPLSVVIFAMVTAWFNLKGDVQAQTANAKQIERQAKEHRERIQQNEQAIQELRTQGAVNKNTQEQMKRTLNENRTDLKSILNAVRK